MRGIVGTRNLLRSTLIGATVRLRLDELALRMQRWLARYSPRMIVVVMHETPTRDETKFRNQLEWVARHFTLVDLQTFSQYWQEAQHGTPKFSKPLVLFTFDDGRLSNYLVAAPVLEAFDARGVFFVIPEWVECKQEEARKFYYSRIDSQPTPAHTEEDWRSMNSTQIAELVRRGHSIGSHTYSHVKLVGLTGSQLRREIVESAAKIASWTERPVDTFAWTFSWDTISREAWDLIRQHYRFCFAPCPGTIVCRSDSPQLIWRKELEVRYLPSETRFMYSGLVDSLWRSQRQRLKKLLLMGRVGLGKNP